MDQYSSFTGEKIICRFVSTYLLLLYKIQPILCQKSISLFAFLQHDVIVIECRQGKRYVSDTARISMNHRFSIGSSASSQFIFLWRMFEIWPANYFDL